MITGSIPNSDPPCYHHCNHAVATHLDYIYAETSHATIGVKRINLHSDTHHVDTVIGGISIHCDGISTTRSIARLTTPPRAMNAAASLSLGHTPSLRLGRVWTNDRLTHHHYDHIIVCHYGHSITYRRRHCDSLQGVAHAIAPWHRRYYHQRA